MAKITLFFSFSLSSWGVLIIYYRRLKDKRGFAINPLKNTAGQALTQNRFGRMQPNYPTGPQML